MSDPKSYHQHCGLARALDAVGERWTLLIVRELLLGTRRYTQLRESLQGITTNLLAERLQRMQKLGLIEKTETGYRLTAAGAELEPAIMALGRWGGRFMGTMNPLDRRNLGWALISFKRRYAGGQRLTVEMDTGERVFELTFAPEGVVVREQPAAAPDLRLKGPEAVFFELLFGDPKAACTQLSVEGDWAAFARILAGGAT